jgi:hypothetical protein
MFTNSLGSSWLSGLSASGGAKDEEGARALGGDAASSSSSSGSKNHRYDMHHRRNNSGGKTLVMGNAEPPATAAAIAAARGGGEKSIRREPYNNIICQPYKVEVLDRELLGHGPGAGRRTAVIETLRQMGIKVFVIDAQNTTTTDEIIQHIRRVVGFVARENGLMNNGRLAAVVQQRVLFYQDEQGRLFNLILSRHVTGPAGTWREYLECFSGPEALVALTLLCRSLPCIAANGMVTTHAQFCIPSTLTLQLHLLYICIFPTDVVPNLKPAYLSVVLGLVLTEEISLSWLNASMLIRATPSVSAHALTSPLGSDSLRKLVLFTLAFASATNHWGLTMIGVVGAIILLLANLGARSWHALGWRPLRYTGFGSFWIAYLLAVGTGFVFPYMGHSTIAMGGKGALEYVLRTAVLVAVVFVLSDIDELQRFVVIGSEVNPNFGIF